MNWTHVRAFNKLQNNRLVCRREQDCVYRMFDMQYVTHAERYKLYVCCEYKMYGMTVKVCFGVAHIQFHYDIRQIMTQIFDGMYQL